jgi:4'-phosphopantetheinyl transferase EntD
MAWTFEQRAEPLGPFAYHVELSRARLVVARLTAHELESIAVELAPDRKLELDGMSDLRRRTWLGGRAALSLVCGELGTPGSWAQSDDRGAPLLPPGLRGSIAHKVVDGEVVVAAIATRSSEICVGVDVELDRALDTGLARRILTADEAAGWPAGGEDSRGRWLLARFSMKEAVYKSIDPTLRRYVGFQEVELREARETAEQDGLDHRVAWHGPESLQLDIRTGAARLALGPTRPCLVSVAIASRR